MSDFQAHSPSVSRRDFIAATAAGTALASLGGSQSASAKVDHLTDQMAKGSELSDKAYKKARSRAATLVARMTLEEKISQLGNSAPAIKRLGLSGYQYWSEALHGVTGTSFPQPLSLAGAWDPKLAHRVYTAVSDEARAWHNRSGHPLTFYSPQTLNLHRDPRWGRCEEALGEDPCLASTLVTHVVRAMQGDNPDYLKTTACAKHFICNNTDSDRQRISATVDLRNFWEYYTRSYRAAVIDGGVYTVMGAYNAINGVPCCADHFLLTDLLRKRWGFRGYVTSDCDAIYNIFDPHHYASTVPQAAAMAINAGCDLNCGGALQKYLKKAVSQNLVSEEHISLALTRILTARFLLGEFDAPELVPYSRISPDVINSPAHQMLALQAARESIILLKNEENFLPLDKTKLKTIAVIGPMANQAFLGQYTNGTYERISPVRGVQLAMGCVVTPSGVFPDQATQVHGAKTQGASDGWTNFGFISSGSWIEYKPQDFTGKTGMTIRSASANKGGKISVHLDSLDQPSIATIPVGNTGGWQKWKDYRVAIDGVTGKHKVFLKVTGGGGFLLNIESFELTPQPPQPPAVPGQALVLFKPGCTIQGAKDEKMFAEAVNAAKKADLVIMVCGVNSSIDGEGHDRKNTNLTGVQHDLIKACYQANPKTLLVISSNNTVAVNWEQENLPAIVSALFAGQAQGTAIADILFGNYNPGGKTCCTWYKSVDQLPPFHNYDIMKGRTYMYFEGEPLYPFGYGLSYTRFKFSDLYIAKATLAVGESIVISAQITNIGLYSGAEVAQFYITAPQSPVKRPIKELVGFQRVELQPGESKTVTFTLPYNAQALWYWHESRRQFVLQPGTLKLLIGSSSADIHLTGDVDLQACTDATLGGPETLRTVAVPAAVS